MSHIDKNKEIRENWDRFRLRSNARGDLSYDAIADWWLDVLSRREQEIKEFVLKKKAEAEKLHKISESFSTSGYMAACDDVLSLLK